MPNTQTNPKQIRSTKIVATLGPASDERIEQLVISGVDAFRLNFSHGSHAQHLARINRIREVATKLNSFVAIIADLQGPKIRTPPRAPPLPSTPSSQRRPALAP